MAHTYVESIPHPHSKIYIVTKKKIQLVETHPVTPSSDDSRINGEPFSRTSRIKPRRVVIDLKIMIIITNQNYFT